jgi:phosphatidylserine decarboxylase
VPIAKEGWKIAAICILIALLGWVIHPLILIAGIGAALFTLYFFRDPERNIVATAGQILAPADGKVLSIDDVDDPDFMGGRCKRISIFLSIFDVHINRAPVGGVVSTVRYNRGKFGFANTTAASLLNESNFIGIDGTDTKFAVKQIAGAVARRIICYCHPQQSVQAGERIGMIRFGSRTELYVPYECEISVSVGDRVKGGLSLVGAYNVEDQKTP